MLVAIWQVCDFGNDFRLQGQSKNLTTTAGVETRKKNTKIETSIFRKNLKGRSLKTCSLQGWRSTRRAHFAFLWCPSRYKGIESFCWCSGKPKTQRFVLDLDFGACCWGAPCDLPKFVFSGVAFAGKANRNWFRMFWTCTALQIQDSGIIKFQKFTIFQFYNPGL